LDIKKTADFTSRFKGLTKPTEGEIASQFNHPHIVKTLEHGITTRNEQYVVMEFLEGPGLNSLIIGRDERLEGNRLNLIRQIAQALQAVHKAGFIHRDICPRNLVADLEAKNLKLIDFGLTVPATAPYMLPGNRTGTPNYMAPELVKRQKTDQRLDVFAFGVTAFEILTYELPWQRGTTGQAAMTHANEDAVDLRKYRRQVDLKLAKAITSCITQRVEARCASMDEFLKMIRDVKHEDVDQEK
jgi:serine/threonine-protein kinase